MRLSEYSIRRYGPLRDSGRVILDDFNLIFGRNEEGKTLTIDALVKLLMGRKFGDDFESLDRVEENPDGFVVISNHRGEKIKIPEEATLTRATDLTSTECNNIFIVRNSNLSIARDAEFYSNVTDRLTGLRTDQIKKIIEKLRDMGGITPTGHIRDIRDEKLKTRINNAESLRGRIGKLKKDLKNQDYPDYQEKLAELTEGIDQAGEEIENLEAAEKRQKYERGRDALRRLREARRKLEVLKIYNRHDEQNWRDSLRDMEFHEKEKDELLKEREETEKEAGKKEEELREFRSHFETLRNRKSDIDEIRPRIEYYQNKKKELVEREERDKTLKYVSAIAPILMTALLVSLVFSDSLFIIVGAFLFFILTVISGIEMCRLSRHRASLAGMLESIRDELARYELDSDKAEGILSNIQKFYENFQHESDRLQDIRREEENLSNNLDKLKGVKIPEKEDKIRETREKTDQIKSKSREDNLNTYTEKLSEKTKLEREAGEHSSSLASLLGREGEQPGENMEFWKKELEKLETYQGRAVGINPDENRLRELKKQKEDYIQKLRRTRDQISSIQEVMNQVERETNEILPLQDEYLPCQTMIDLEGIENRLTDFIQAIRDRQERSLEAISIFEEIEDEEKEKVSRLFGRSSPVSKYFSSISDGLYREVIFNRETERVQAKRNDQVLDAEKLSGGTYDQLYFSIRLALGEELLKGDKGFFILDDPFIKADFNRLRKQMEMLRILVKSGWQIIYFSAKDEIRKVLDEDIKNNRINLIQPPGLME